MKINLKKLFGVIIIGLMACGDVSTAPGKGPAFTSTTTASELWNMVSAEIYVPYSLRGNDSIVKETADCNVSGKAEVRNSETGNIRTKDITYADCSAHLGFDDVLLKQNGTAHLVFERKGAKDSAVGIYTYQQHVSISGDIGLAADCDFTLEISSDTVITPSTYKFDGECIYTDSEGTELKIKGAEMTDYVFAQ